MNNNDLRDVSDYLTDIQQINLNIAFALRNLQTRTTDAVLRAHLSTLAAASELTSDKATVIMDYIPEKGAEYVG